MSARLDDPRTRLFDVNVLLAMALTTHVHHRAAIHAVSSVEGSWATCPLTESALLRLLINPRVTGTDFPASQVIAILKGMRSHPRWTFLEDAVTPTAPSINFSVITGHSLVTDFHLVDLAARNGAVLATFDSRLGAALDPADRGHVDITPA